MYSEVLGLARKFPGALVLGHAFVGIIDIFYSIPGKEINQPMLV